METDESDQKIAVGFRVSRSFVNKIVRQYSRCGNYEALPHGGGAQPKLGTEEMALVIELVEEDNDATLEQLSTRLEQRTGIKVSVSTLCRLGQCLKLTRKKKTLHATEAESERVPNLRQDSPDFNPIENCWSKLKQYLRTVEARTYETLDRAITEALDLVTDQDIIGWFTHCCYYAPPN